MCYSNYEQVIINGEIMKNSSSVFIIKSLAKSVFIGILFCTSVLLVLSFFVENLYKFVDLIIISVCFLGSIVCSRFCSSKMKKRRVFLGVISSILMLFVMTLMSAVFYREFRLDKFMIKLLVMSFGGILGSITIFKPDGKSKNKMKRVHKKA